MSGFVQRALFVFDAAACGAVWALLVVGLVMGRADSSLGWSALMPGTIGFISGFFVGGVAGALALRGLDEARVGRALYVIVGVFVLGMVLLRLAARAGYGAF